MPSRRAARIELLGLTITLASAACTYPATQVHVAIDTDAPSDRALTIRATVHSDDSGRTRMAAHTWIRGGPLGDATLPATFAVTPGELPHEAHVELVIEASLEASATQPRLAFRRTARFGFTQHRTTTVPIFLNVACGNESRDCTTAGVACTVSQRCEEQGLTCGDRGECVPRDVTPEPVDPDAGPRFPDVVPNDIGTDSIDAPTDTPIDTTVDAQLDAPVDSIDAAADVANDAPLDVVTDVQTDVPGDVPTDVPTDTLVDPEPPRLVAPRSTSTVASSRPGFRWISVPGVTGARIEICPDRACTTVTTTFDAGPGDGSPTTALTPGVWFWRARGLAGVIAGSRTSPTWEFIVRTVANVPTVSHGTMLDVNGDGLADFAVGAPSADGDLGRVDVFHGRRGSAPGPRETAIAGLATNHDFGWHVTSAGDVNGDGYGDLAISAPAFESTGDRVYVYPGSAMGVGATPLATLNGSGVGISYFGGGVTAAGDVNGDGYADLLVGDPRDFTSPGHAYLFLGSASGPSTTAAIDLVGPDGAGDYFGRTLASVGDYDHDGFDDVIVTAYAAASDAGAAYVFRGTATGLASTPAMSFAPPGTGTQLFGSAVACDDFDGDGDIDLVIGASGLNASDAGHAYYYAGTSAGWPAVPTATLLPAMGMPGNYFGDTLVASDVDGDGFADAVVGAPHDSSNAGKAWVFHGHATGLSIGASTILFATDGANGNFAGALGSGDYNGDGADDVIAGAPGAMSNAGAAYVFFGRPGSGLLSAPTAQLGVGGAANDAYGHSVGR